MREGGETCNAPTMALAHTGDGEAEAYAPMELGDPSGDEVEKRTRRACRNPTRKMRKKGGRYGIILYAIRPGAHFRI